MGKVSHSDQSLLRREFIIGLVSILGAFVLGRLFLGIFAPKLQKSKYTKLPNDSIFSPEKPHNL